MDDVTRNSRKAGSGMSWLNKSTRVSPQDSHEGQVPQVHLSQQSAPARKREGSSQSQTACYPHRPPNATQDFPLWAKQVGRPNDEPHTARAAINTRREDPPPPPHPRGPPMARTCESSQLQLQCEQHEWSAKRLRPNFMMGNTFARCPGSRRNGWMAQNIV